jgi:hypothetical protein
MTVTNKQKERVCSDCGLPKLKSAFRKKDKRCWECRKRYISAYKQLRRAGQPRQTRYAFAEVGIETWEQVESVIREMAESQFRINEEYAGMERRIALLKKNTDVTVEPELIHQINFRSILKAFLKKTCPKGQAITKYCAFGIIKFHRGKLDVELDTTLARMRMDNP